jgi:singapore isolate B (sub-type 7) whole genome shotgun sequence assembly, scaffold_0
MFTIVFWVVGKGYISSDVIVKTMSRTGKASELSMGPVHYGVIMTLVTYFFWKQLDAVFIIMTVSFGDGFAAWIGSIRSGNRSLWWNRSKSWYGLVAYVFFSTVGIVSVCQYLSMWKPFDDLISRQNLMRIADKNYVMNALIVSIVCGLTETLTIPNYDNITIFVVSILTYNYVK